MTQDANDFLMGGSITSAKFDTKGKTVKGIIVRKPELQQQRDFDDQSPKTWDDGSPMYQVKVIIATDERNDDDDDGERALYLKGNSLKAVQAAVKKAGEKGIAAGGKLALKYTGDAAPKKKGMSGAKQYQALYEAPDPMAQAAANEPEPEPEAQPEPAAEDDADLKF